MRALAGNPRPSGTGGGQYSNDSGRWTEHRTLVFRHDGILWAADYERGLTENQETEAFEGETTDAYEVEARDKVVVEYVRKAA